MNSQAASAEVNDSIRPQPKGGSVESLVRPSRTDEEIVAQTNKLAFTLALLSGYAFDADYKFHLHTRLASCPMPRQAQYWEMARQAQLLLTDTDPDDAVANLD